ncbi:mu-type opioid receptor [Biomphalaria glabrata]|nr:mu-type opioid receptor [Biomphalaria glabrata]
MIVFLKPGYKDGMRIELFSLAITDFFVSILVLAFTVLYLASIFCVRSPVDLWALAYVPFVWAVNALYLISCWITAMVSLERCFSVVFPFAVRHIFTARRSLILIVIIYAFHIALFLPAFIIDKMEWVALDEDNSGNFSSLSESPQWIYTVVFSEAAVELDVVLDITAGLFLFISSQLVLFVCSLCMTVSLKLSSAVRTANAHSEDKVKVNSSHLTNQERRLIWVVLFLSVLHTVCNVPRLSLIIFYHAYPWLNLDSQQNAVAIVWTIMTIFSSMTCSSSIWGYYTLNSKYRNIFIRTFKINNQKQ